MESSAFSWPMVGLSQRCGVMHHHTQPSLSTFKCPTFRKSFQYPTKFACVCVWVCNCILAPSCTYIRDCTHLLVYINLRQQGSCATFPLLVHPFLEAISHWACVESTLNSIAATCSLNVTGIGVEIRPARWAVRNKTAPKTNGIQWLLGREAGV